MGTARAPEAIFKASLHIDIFDAEMPKPGSKVISCDPAIARS